MKDFMKKILGSKTTWISIVVGALSIAYVVVMGGSIVQTFPGKNGSEYEVQLQIAEGVIELVEQCKLKEVGQECEVALNVKVKMTKAPTTSIEPVKEEVKPATPIETDAVLKVVPKDVKEKVSGGKVLKEGEVIAPIKVVNTKTEKETGK